MLGWAIGRQEVLILAGFLFGLAGIGGLVLFIVGLTTKKPVLWGIGIGLMLLPLLVLGAGVSVYILARG